jgi:hypothetical protein
MQQLLLSLALSCGLAVSAFAQFGVSGSYTLTDYATGYDPAYLNSAWNDERPTDGFRVAIDYWFRLKKPRIEFLPTLSFTRGRTFTLRDGNELNYQHGSFFFNTNIYLFDLAGDCGCPTFSKGGPALQKGLFLQLGPGVTLARNQVTAADATAPLAAGTQTSTHWGIQGGLGLDIGLNELITVSPIVGVRYYPEGPELYDLPRVPEAVAPAAPQVWQYFGGLRLGLRFDQ